MSREKKGGSKTRFVFSRANETINHRAPHSLSRVPFLPAFFLPRILARSHPMRVVVFFSFPVFINCNKCPPRLGVRRAENKLFNPANKLWGIIRIEELLRGKPQSAWQSPFNVSSARSSLAVQEICQDISSLKSAQEGRPSKRKRKKN